MKTEFGCRISRSSGRSYLTCNAAGNGYFSRVTAYHMGQNHFGECNYSKEVKSKNFFIYRYICFCNKTSLRNSCIIIEYIQLPEMPQNFFKQGRKPVELFHIHGQNQHLSIWQSSLFFDPLQFFLST